ncbi:hypothetical protein CCR75_005600 [Bremia lactucae]|uniref:Guanine nucleotide-binding protein subunit beta-like protein n=1 Tax=Bremia lactucae TaxID=4779 RepID=A0A976FPR7_BRELC|nr:hypothetical protein CCR75_005600 [Bremia lactucae]
MSSLVSRHYVSEKVKSLCFVKDVRYASETMQDEALPLIASGGWDNETNYVTLHLPVRTTGDENELRKEFELGEMDPRPCELNTLIKTQHDGDVNALQFVAVKGEKLLLSASSTGGLFAFRISSDDAAMSDEDSTKLLDAYAIPQWEQVFAGNAATCVEVSENRTSLVSASTDGALAWFKLDEVAAVEILENKNTSKLPINAVKFLGRDSVVASVGSTPGGQLRIWDVSVNSHFPIATCTDSSNRSLTTLETHPTRPELLITGSNDGCVSCWDRRKLNVPFRSETHHQRTVRALTIHSASPRFLYSGGDDAVVHCWDFTSRRNSLDPVAYDYYDQSTAIDRSNVSGFTEERGIQVQRLALGSQPCNALAVHAESDTLIAGSDAQSIMIVQNVSKSTQKLGEMDPRPCELNTLIKTQHDGDVNALQFVAVKGEKLLLSASSTGGLFAFRISSDDAAMSDEDSTKLLDAYAIPQWEQVFAGNAATCVEVSENRTSLVSASTDGALAWFKLDEVAAVEILENKNTSKLPINAVKFLGRDSVVASVGSTPGGQLRIWDVSVNSHFPIATCTDSSNRSLTTLETHPTRPELLITGSNDGCVSCWDRRKLNVPFRSETHHQRTVRALTIHSASPRFLYSGGDDAVVHCWDFTSRRNSLDPVAYDYYDQSTAIDRSNVSGFTEERGIQVQRLALGSQPCNALAVHAESDTLIAGSDAQSIMIVQNVSKSTQK